jgi:hypothetical protein
MNDAHYAAMQQQTNHVERATVLLASVLLTYPEKAVIPAEGCEHLLKVGVNNAKAVCVLCRTVLEEPTSSGLCIRGPVNAPPTSLGGYLPVEDPDLNVPAITHFMGYLGPEHISEIAACELTDDGPSGPSQAGTFSLGGIIGPAKDVANFISRFGNVTTAKDRWLQFSRGEQGPAVKYDAVVLVATGRQFIVGSKTLVSSLRFMYIRKFEGYVGECPRVEVNQTAQ